MGTKRPLDDRITGWTLHLTAYLLCGAVWLRALVRFAGTPALLPVIIMLLFYLALLISEERIAARLRWYPPLYFSVQTVLVLLLIRTPDHQDFFWLLYMALCLQAMRRFPPRVAYAWAGLFVAVGVVSLVLWLGPIQGLALMGVFSGMAFFVSSYALAIVRAQAARAATQSLLAEVQQANRQLADYSAQVGRLAVARERSRMAREVHDSVTQTIFSMTLTTQSALLLLERDPARAVPQVERAQELANLALSEMRSLMVSLPSQRIAEPGLVALLRRHAADRGLRTGLSVTVEVDGSGNLSSAEEEALFRIAQEALNNVAKHAGTSQAAVRLHLEAPAWIEISDRGRGFDVSRATSGGQVGLASMRERAEEIGWSLTIDSALGSGTRVRLTAPQAQEG